MIIKVNLKLGNASYQIEVDEKDELEALNKAIVLANPRSKCLCGNNDPSKMYFTSNKDKEGNIYVNVKCAACGARSKLGRYKTGGYFWHEFEKYVPTTPKIVVEEESDPFDN